MKFIIVAILAFFSLNLNAQTVLLDESFTSGIPSNWTIVDVDGNTPNIAVSQFTSAWIGFTTLFDTCAASTSYYADSATSEDYLITPQLNLLGGGNMFSWEAKSFDGTYPDSYIVLISTTDTNPSSFTDTLKVVSNESPYWTTYTYNLADLGYANQSIYVAFKNISSDAYILGVDNVKMTTNVLLSINENVLEENTVEIYPNPTTSFFNIVADEFINAKLYDLSGQLILESNQKSANVMDLPKGMYIVNVTTKNGTLEKKLMVY